MTSGPAYALFAGVVAAASSVCAKLSLGTQHVIRLCEAGLSGWSAAQDGAAACDWLHLPLRLLCGALLLACNSVMWYCFTKALRYCSSSARATVTTTASNFICSAVLGRLLFGESHDAVWWAGVSLTLCGLLLLHGAAPQTLPQEDKKDE